LPSMSAAFTPTVSF